MKIDDKRQVAAAADNHQPSASVSFAFSSSSCPVLELRFTNRKEKKKKTTVNASSTHAQDDDDDDGLLCRPVRPCATPAAVAVAAAWNECNSIVRSCCN